MATEDKAPEEMLKNIEANLVELMRRREADAYRQGQEAMREQVALKFPGNRFIQRDIRALKPEPYPEAR